MASKDKKAKADKPKSKGGKGKTAKPKTGSVKIKVKTGTKPAAARVKDLARSAASNPVVAEVVAATLVAAAAAMRDPAKARQIAAAAGDELKNLTKSTGKSGEAMWQLAMDVAGRSIKAFGAAAQGGAAEEKKKAKKGAE